MPSSEHRVRFANCRRTRASSRTAAVSGSAATTRPANRDSNRPHGTDPSTKSTIDRSTDPAASTDRCRVRADTSRTLPTRAWRATTRAQINGNRCRTSNASAR